MRKEQKGAVIIIALVFLSVMLAMSSALVGYTSVQLMGERKSYAEVKAFTIAEAGIDKAIYEINADPSYQGEMNTILGDGQLDIEIATIGTDSKQVTATGYYPDSGNPQATKTVRVTLSINSSRVSFNFGVQVGAGGLSMSNNSAVVGNMYSNGNISGTGQIQGDAVVASGVNTVPETEWTVQDTEFEVGNSSSTVNVAQSFINSTTGMLGKIAVNLKKVGSPNDLSVRILTDNNGSPSRSTVAIGSIPASSVAGSFGFVDASFSSTPNLNAGQRYWITLIAANNSGNYFVWGSDSADGYGNGTSKSSSNWNANNPSWTNIGEDMDFKLYMGNSSTSLSGVTVTGTARARTLNSCTVTGDAYFGTTNTCTVGGTLYPNQQDPPAQAMPISDSQIQEWRDIAGSGTVHEGSLTVNAITANYGPAVINGDLTLTNGATLELTGPLWVKGNITFLNNSIVRVSALLGGAGTVLMADNPADMVNSGIINISNNTVFSGSGSSSSFPLVVSTSSSPSAINLSNNAIGGIFYAANGTILVSNNVEAKQLTGYSISLSNNATITYTSGLANANFANGPGGSWVFEPGSYVIVK